MKTIYALGGNVAALGGILLCLVAGLARLLGFYYVAGFAASTLLLAGIALLVLACLAKLQLLLLAQEADR